MKVNGKYKAFEDVPAFNRTWPTKHITHAPIWCSVDLRDGNQALINPMGVEQKLEFFDLLVKLGFKQIEIGFPSASDTEFAFTRRLIEENHVPEDVSLQVLCQAREHLIKRTFESLKGCKKAIFHLYNSTSPAQRKYTFGKSKEEIKQIAIDGIRCVKSCLSMSEGTEIQLEYSPESFSTTEIDYAIEVCEAVVKEWGDAADENHKVILNLPSTVECAMPNQFADQIEYFCQNFPNRENIIISLHNHNDRGEGVAQCELGLLAGADRVEGCLFGNGERTGNLDIVNVGLNMFTQGIDPELDFTDIPAIAEAYQKYTGAAVAEMLINVLPDVAGKIAEPLSQIDKIIIMDGGNGDGNGVSNVAGNVTGVMTQVFESMKEVTGVDLADLVKAKGYDAQVTKNVNITTTPQVKELEEIAAAKVDELVE